MISLSQKMNWLQKSLIVLVVGLFIFNHRTAIINQYRDNTPVMTSEEITALEKRVENVYATAKEKIEAGTYTPLDWQRDIYFLRCKVLQPMGGKYSYGSYRFYELAGEAYQYTIDRYYTPQRDEPKRALFFQQEVNNAQAQVMRENNERVDWGRGFQALHLFMLAFLPYSLLIIFVRRSTKYKVWQIVSAGDVICVLVCTGFSVFGAIAYRPNNFLQKRIDSQLQIWKVKIGARGWRLALAYLVAIIISLATLIRPAKSQAQTVVETKVVSMVPAAAVNQEETDNQHVFFPEKIVGFLRRFFEEIMKGIETVVYSLFSIMIIQFFSPPLEFIWGMWARPPDKILFWITRALGSRAPANFVQFNSRINWTKNKGVRHENQNCSFYNLGVVCSS